MGLLASGQAGTTTIDFNTDPTGTGLYEAFGAGEWREGGGATGGASDGYLSVTDARAGQRSVLVFKDLEAGLVVKAFSFECDLRIGGGANPPADGFSINYARDTDPVVTSGTGTGFAGAGTEVDLPEEGTLTGLGLGFDTWQSGAHPGTITDVVGISVRVDGTLIAQFPLPVQPGNMYTTGTPANYVNDDTTRNLATDHPNYLVSMQTGARNTTDDLNEDGEVTAADVNTVQPSFADRPDIWGLWVKNLKWEKFKADIKEDGKLSLFWKGVELTPAGGLQTTFSPSPGRIVFAARTGDNHEVHHVDNIVLTTIPADNLIVGQATSTPIGFAITTIDSGPAVADPATLLVKFDGADLTPTSVSKSGITTTIAWSDVTAPLASGSVHTVTLTIRDTRGIEVTETREFTVAPYVTLPPAYAVTDVNTAQRGFNVKVHQTATRNQETTVARAEQQLQGIRGANVADLTTGFTDGVYAETGVINYNQVTADGFTPEQGGFFYLPADTTTIPAERQIADLLIPGTPSTTEFNADSTYYTDNMAAEITTYLHFPSAGVYNLIFSSDDGFRTTASPAYSEVLTSLLIVEADIGKGADDVVGTVYVAQAGYYPFRTVWFEGGGGASLEWSAQLVAPTVGTRYLINDNAAGALKAYRSRTGTIPASVSFLHPFRASGNPYVGSAPLIAKVQDGSTAVDQASIRMLLNGAEVAATKSKAGDTTTVNFDPPGSLPSNTTNELTIQFTAGAQTYSGSYTFVVRSAPVVPASLALPASAVNTANRGFLFKAKQQDLGRDNDTYSAELHYGGYIGWPNIIDPAPFTGPSGYYVETDVINYNQGTWVEPDWNPGDSGYFTGDALIPGVPGLLRADSTRTSDNGTDNIVAEILTVLDLQPGIYAFNFNSDDGFRTTVGNPSEWWTFPVVVGEFSGGRGNGAGLNDGTTYYFEITQAGLYPFRTLWYEGGGGANLEWSVRQFDPTTGLVTAGTLINDGTATGAIRAYQYPITSAGATYVKSIAPARSGRASTLTPARAGTDAVVKVVIVEGTGSVEAAGVSLRIDGATVTPTVTKAGGEAIVSYAPAGGWAANSTHTASLTFGDRTIDWTFAIGATKTPVFFIEAEDYNSAGASQAAASQMPYTGGAFAGLGATHETDYREVDVTNDSPLYRVGENPPTPLDRTGDRDRGLGEIVVNYKAGWVASGQWYNYTRDFPAGTYNVYAAVSHGDAADSATRIGGNLAKIAGATPEPLGAFAGPATGGWGNNSLLPLMDVATTNTMVALPLSGTQTLRYTTQNGDWDFMLFVPVGDSGPTPTIGISPAGVITYTGTLEASTTVNGTYSAVTGATSPYTVPKTGAAMFYRAQSQ